MLGFQFDDCVGDFVGESGQLEPVLVGKKGGWSVWDDSIAGLPVRRDRVLWPQSVVGPDCPPSLLDGHGRACHEGLLLYRRLRIRN